MSENEIRAVAVREVAAHIDRIHKNGLVPLGTVIADIQASAYRMERGMTARGSNRRVVAEEPEGEHVFIERYGIYHAKFGGIGGDVTSLTLTREAWKAMGEPGVLAVTYAPVKQEGEPGDA